MIAAGNSGPGRRTIESPGISPSAITVGAVDDRRTLTQKDDRITSYSSRGPAPGGRKKPDLVAPGETIISLRAPHSKLDRELPYLQIAKNYFVLSGTSVSTPIVSGVIAQLLQRNPSLTPKQVKSILKKNTFSLKLPLTQRALVRSMQDSYFDFASFFKAVITETDNTSVNLPVGSISNKEDFKSASNRSK